MTKVPLITAVTVMAETPGMKAPGTGIQFLLPKPAVITEAGTDMVPVQAGKTVTETCMGAETVFRQVTEKKGRRKKKDRESLTGKKRLWRSVWDCFSEFVPAPGSLQ